MKIKVCGMRKGENIRQVAALGVDYIGMIFYAESPRFVTMIPTHAGIIPDKAAPTSLPETADVDGRPAVKTVGVFVDEMPQNIITRVVNFGLDVIQLHGSESPTLIRNLRATIDPDLHRGIQIWKTIHIPDSNDRTVWHEAIATCQEYDSCVDAFLFDTVTPQKGGSGRHFDWCVLDDYTGGKPFMLSGGIGPDDIRSIREFQHPKFMGIDLNSLFETEPGVKDVEKLKQFLQQLRTI